MKVKEIMTKKVITAEKDDPVSDIAELLFDKNLNGMPIVDKDNKVIGIVTEYDLMSHGKHIHIPSYVNFLKMFSRKENEKDKRIREEFNNIISIKTKDIMSKDVVTVSENDDVRDIIDYFIKDRINPLPVVDKENSLVGIISRADVVKLFKKLH